MFITLYQNLLKTYSKPIPIIMSTLQGLEIILELNDTIAAYSIDHFSIEAHQSGLIWDETHKINKKFPLSVKLLRV